MTTYERDDSTVRHPPTHSQPNERTLAVDRVVTQHLSDRRSETKQRKMGAS